MLFKFSRHDYRMFVWSQLCDFIAAKSKNIY
jgi:hypothetical protein